MRIGKCIGCRRVDGVMTYVEELVRAVGRAVPDRLVGAYLHGSLAIGGYVAGRSDIDLLIVVDGQLSKEARTAVADTLIGAHDTCPAVGIESSAVTAAAAASGGADCSYQLHVTTNPDDKAVILGGERDPDLVLHYAVCRQSAIAIAGPPPDEVFGAVPPDRLAEHIRGELEWCLTDGTEAYGVLNACRARAYLVTGRLMSKIEGAAWALSRGLASELVQRVLDAQEGRTEHQSASRESKAFIAASIALMDRR